jgi:hypothetical protein
VVRRTAFVASALCLGAVVTTLAPVVSSAGGGPATTIVDPISSAPVPIGALCTDATTTSTIPTTTAAMAIAPSLCDVVAQLPADRVTAEWDSIWDGTVSGSVQPVGCTPVAQTGAIVLIALADGEVFGLGRTDTGGYGCDNGVDVPPSSYAYGIAGERADRLTLKFEDGVTIASGPIVDGRAVLQQDTGFGVVTIELRCRDCATDAPESTVGVDATA